MMFIQLKTFSLNLDGLFNSVITLFAFLQKRNSTTACSLNLYILMVIPIKFVQSINPIEIGNHHPQMHILKFIARVRNFTMQLEFTSKRLHCMIRKMKDQF